MTTTSHSLTAARPPRPGASAVSVVILLGHRYDDLGELCGALRRALTPVTGPYEVVIVDDATGPQTQAKLRRVSEQFPEVRTVRVRRTAGESAALAIGAQSARGEIIITFDPYLHVAVEELPKLYAALADDVDLVCTWRHPRLERGISRLASEAFNAAARWLTRVPVHDLNSRTRVMRRAVLEHLPLYGDLHRFLPIFAARRGFAWREVQVPQQPGKHEIGAQDVQSYARRFLDLVTLAFLTRFVKRPLHFFGLVGMASFAVGLALSLHLTYVKLVLGLAIGHRPLLLFAVLCIVLGLQIASIGLLAEVMIFTHARDLKDYVVEEDLGA